MIRPARCCLVLSWLILVAASAHAQVSATTGSINGVVSDTSQSVLPGVTVTISSPTLQGVRTAVSGPDGGYRFPAVPAGDYKVAYELSGFATVVREQVRVGLGFTATLNIELPVATLSESITVAGQSPVVDVTSSKTTTNFDEEKLASLPSARDLWSILGHSPSVQVQRVDVGGSAAGTQTGYSVYDTKADQHRPTVEGIVMTEGTGAAGFYYDYGSFQEVSVGTASYAADMGWPGVQTQFVAKSGGNAYHGKVYADYQNGGIQSHNIDDAQIAAGLRGSSTLPVGDLNRNERYYDLNADVGGFLKKDKLWWYGSVRDQEIRTNLPNYTVGFFKTRLSNVSGKATYSLNTNNKLIGYTQWGRKEQPNRLDAYLIGSSSARYTAADATWNQAYWGYVNKGEWQSVLSDKMFLEVRAGEFGYDWPNHRYTEAPRYEDLGNNNVSGGNREWALNRARTQSNGSLTVFKDRWLGTHNFKVGYEVMREWDDSLRGFEGVAFSPNDIIHVLRNGTPIEYYAFESPSVSKNGLWTYSAYLSDTWQPARRLTFNAGVRYDRYRSYLPAQEHVGGVYTTGTQTFEANSNVNTFNNFSPRIGANFDLTGAGKTLVKANYGRYWWNPGTTLATNVNPNPTEWYQRRAWTDLNGNLVVDAGETGAILSSTGGITNVAISPDLNNTYTDEVAGWLEHELMDGFGVRTGVVYRRIGDVYQSNLANRPYSAFTVPVTVRDPGPDGVVGNGDDGAPIQAFNLDPTYLSRPTVRLLENVAGESEFWTYEITANKRLSKGWSMLASFSYRWNYDYDDSYFGNNLRSRDMPANPNEAINTDGGRYNFQTWGFHVNGTYDAPYGIRVSPTLRHQSGQPYGRTILASLNYGSQRILTEPLNSRRQDNVTIVDTRFEKALTLAGRKVSGFIDVYNIFNENPAQNINWGSGSTFQTPSVIVSPRIVRFGGKFDW